MKYQISNRKFNIILEELAEEYKELLIEAALTQNNEIDIENISISELTKIDSETKERLKNRSRNRRINRMSDLISMTGLLYSLFGLMLIMVSSNENRFLDSTLSTMAIICVFIGFIIALIGMIMKPVLSNKKSVINRRQIFDYEFQVINKWRILEGIIYQISPENDRLSLKSMINNLEQSKLISKDDMKTLSLLMNVRNRIVHRSYGEVEFTEEIKDVLENAQKLIDKLSDLI